MNFIIQVDEDAIARRRELMRQRALYKAQAGDVQVGPSSQISA